MALNSILNRTVDTVRGGLDQAAKLGRDAANRGFGLGKQLTNRGQAKDLDDVTLTRKVETEIFRPANSPKGTVDVNAVEGVVWLRGEVKNQKQIAEIEGKVRSIPEVRGVENLLHLPKTPAPSRQRGGAKKTTTKRAASAKSSSSSQSSKSTGPGKRFDRAKTAEKPKSTSAEPLPAQAASSGTGRKAAPLGTKDTEAPATTTPDSLTGGTSPTPAGNGGGSGTGSAS